MEPAAVPTDLSEVLCVLLLPLPVADMKEVVTVVLPAVLATPGLAATRLPRLLPEDSVVALVVPARLPAEVAVVVATKFQ